MKIIYDNFIYNLQNAGGISRYWYELSKRLIRDKKDVLFIEQGDSSKNIFRNKLEVTPSQIYKLSNQIPILERYLNLKVRNTGADFIFHSSYFRTLKQVGGIKVVTIPDFIHEKFYSGPRALLHSYQKARVVTKSDKIIVISENTKNDLLEFYPNIDSNKIKRIYIAASSDFYTLNSEYIYRLSNLILKTKYVLFVGSREGYKNFDKAIELVKYFSDFKLFIVGAALNRNEEILLNMSIPGRWMLFNNIESSVLNELYNNAFCLLYLSSYEGFGIPILEAMNASCPFIALNKSSIPEVAGDAGVLVETLDLDALKQAVHFIDVNRSELIARGHIQSCKFSWEACYQDTLSYYYEP